MHRYRAAAFRKISDSNLRLTPPGSSMIKVNGIVRKSVHEFLFKSVKKNDIGGFMVEPFLDALPVS